MQKTEESLQQRRRRRRRRPILKALKDSQSSTYMKKKCDAKKGVELQKRGQILVTSRSVGIDVKQISVAGAKGPSRPSNAPPSTDEQNKITSNGDRVPSRLTGRRCEGEISKQSAVQSWS